MRYIKNDGLLGDLDEPVFGLDKALQMVQGVLLAIGAVSIILVVSFAWGYLSS